jgi:two-component system sensor histidine kinase PilS (NtrC family)
LRLLLATAALTVLILHEAQIARKAHDAGVALLEPPLYFRPPGLVALIICFLTLVYAPIAKRSDKMPGWAPKLALVQILVDIFLVSALVWNSGGVDSQFVVLYLISICAAAFVLKWNVALVAAAISATLFSLVTLLYSVDFIPQSFRAEATAAQLEHYHKFTGLDFVRLLLLPVCAFFLTGFLAGTLADRLAKARLLHDEILEGIGEGVLVLDNGLNALYHNREFLRMMGLAGNQGSKSLKILMGEQIETNARESLKEGAGRRTDLMFRRPDGSSIPISVRFNPIFEKESSSILGMMLVLDDITAEKKMEEFLKHRQRIETMGQISATIAHEIRNPLASIRGAVQEIGRAIEIPESKKVLLDIVLSESDRLDQIITDFLKFARMRPPRLAQADMGRVLSDVKLLLGARAEARDVGITLEGDEGEPFPADPEQLRQLFLNLGVNALQAMHGQAKKQLTIRVKVISLYAAAEFAMDQVMERPDRPGVLIELQDTGHGMSDKVRRQIFEPFFTTKTAGTGLGLAIVERIVQSHEGVVSVESKEGHGTTIRVWLPTDLKVGASISGLRQASI